MLGNQQLGLGPNTSIKDDAMIFAPEMEAAIEEVAQARDLGITMDSKANFQTHR